MAANTVFVRIQTNSDLAKVVGEARASLEKLAKSPAHHQIATGVRSISEQLDTVRNLYIGLVGILPRVASGAAGAVRLAEAYQQVNAGLKNAAAGIADFAQSQAAVNRIALSARQPLESVAGLYSKLRTNAGFASGDAERLTETLAKAVQLDGGGASAEAALFQLQQGLASGTLRGEELNSVLEQAPSLAKAIADGLDVPVGALRTLAEQGRLTTAEIQRALDDQADEIEARFANLPVTVGQAFTNLRTQAVGEFGKLNESLGLTQALAGLVKEFSANIQATVALSVTAAFAISGAFLQSIATRRAAERTAHIARLREIATETAAALAAAKALPVGAGRGAAVASAAASLVAARGALADAEKSVGALSGAFSGLFGLLRLFTGPVGLALTAVGALTGGLIANRDAVVDLGSGQATLGETVRAAWLLIVQLISSAYGKIKPVFAGIAQAGSAAFVVVWDVAKGTINGLVGLFVAAGKAIGTTFGAIARQVVVNFTGLKDVLSGLFNDIQAALSGDFSFRNFRSAVSRALSDTRQNLGQFADEIKSETAKAFGTDYVGDAAAYVGEALLEQVRKNRDAVADAQAQAFFDQPASGVLGADTTATPDKKTAANQKASNEAARLAEEQARLLADLDDALLARQLANLDIEKQAVEADYADKKLSAQAYYAEVARIETAAEQQRLDALTRARAEAERRAGDPAQAAQAGLDLVKLDTQIAQAQARIVALGRTLARDTATAAAQSASEAFTAAQKVIDAQFESLRQAEARIEARQGAGLIGGRAAGQELATVYNEVGAAVAALLPNAEALAAALAGEGQADAEAYLDGIRTRLLGLKAPVDALASSVAQTFESSFSDAFASFVSGAKTAGEAFRDMANSIISSLARIAAQEVAAGFLKSSGLGAAFSGFGEFFGSLFGVAHTGGVIGSDALAQRLVNPAVFLGAPRFHTGGLVGGEVPIIAKEGEGVFTPEQMAALGPAGSATPVTVNVIESPGNGGQTRTRNEGGQSIVDVLVEQVKSRMIGDVRARGDFSAALESQFGLNRAAGAIR